MPDSSDATTFASILLKLLLFIIINAIGFFAVSLVLYAFLAFDYYPDLESEEDFNAFRHLFMGGSLLFWGACAILSTGYFIAKGKKRYAFLTLPLWLAPFFPILIALIYK